MRKIRIALPGSQRGATLVIALLILVMIMMYGIPAAMDSIQNERMTGNTRNRDLAFQAAEHAIRRAENFWIFGRTAAALNALAPAVLNCSNSPDSPDDADPVTADGILPNGECHANDVAYWRDTFNWTANGVSPASSLSASLVASQPLYVVERMPDVTSGSPPVTRNYYRITARAVGKDSNAVVILQTMYEYSN